VLPTAVENVLKAHGIEPAPKREQSTTWSTFLKAHWYSLFATDFTTVVAGRIECRARLGGILSTIIAPLETVCSKSDPERLRFPLRIPLAVPGE
jgi:hypothetical protein